MAEVWNRVAVLEQKIMEAPEAGSKQYEIPFVGFRSKFEYSCWQTEDGREAAYTITSVTLSKLAVRSVVLTLVSHIDNFLPEDEEVGSIASEETFVIDARRQKLQVNSPRVVGLSGSLRDTCHSLYKVITEPQEDATPQQWSMFLAELERGASGAYGLRLPESERGDDNWHS